MKVPSSKLKAQRSLQKSGGELKLSLVSASRVLACISHLTGNGRDFPPAAALPSELGAWSFAGALSFELGAIPFFA